MHYNPAKQVLLKYVETLRITLIFAVLFAVWQMSFQPDPMVFKFTAGLAISMANVVKPSLYGLTRYRTNFSRNQLVILTLGILTPALGIISGFFSQIVAPVVNQVFWFTKDNILSEFPYFAQSTLKFLPLFFAETAGFFYLGLLAVVGGYLLLSLPIIFAKGRKQNVQF